MITAEEFFRKKIKEKNPNREIVTLSRELITAEEGMRWAHEFKQLHLPAVSGQREHSPICKCENTERIEVVSGSYYWVKLMTDDKHEPAMAINLLGVMNFQFFNGVAVPCDKVNDYSECNYR